MAFRSRLGDLPHDVLCHVMRQCDQDSRTACFTACKALSTAATASGVWDSVSFTDLDYSAVDFVRQRGIQTVTITTGCPDDVSWFLNRLADLGHDDLLRDLTIVITPTRRLPWDLLISASRHCRLRALRLEVQDLQTTCEVPFPRDGRLLDLETLSIEERTEDAKQLVVFFSGAHARFPSLRRLNLDVGLSDVMDGLRHMPNLRHLRYIYDEEEGGETFENADMEGARLDVLELSVGSNIDNRHLCRELEKCDVAELVLVVNDEYLDLRHRLSPSVHTLRFLLNVPHVDIHLDFPFLKESAVRVVSLQLQPWIVDNVAPHPCLVFEHAAVSEFSTLCCSRLSVDVHPSTRVLLTPV